MSRLTRTICLDFDGVICESRGKYIKPDVIEGEPIPGAQEAIDYMRIIEGYRIVVYSSRCNWRIGIEAIRAWLSTHNIVVDQICENKPLAHVYVDDRGVCFNGNWRQTITDITAFRQWQGKRNFDISH